MVEKQVQNNVFFQEKKEGYIKHIGTDKDGDWVVINKTD